MKQIHILIFILVIFQGCIGTDVVEDFVQARVSVENPIQSLKIGDTYQFSAMYINNVGESASADFNWMSSNEEVLTIENDGFATAIKKGSATITVSANGLSDEMILTIADTTILNLNSRTAELKTVSSYPLSGTATLKKESGTTILELDASFNTTSALPGLYVYLSNNTNSISNALEVGMVTSFSGAQSYKITEDISLSAYSHVLFYCKPFLVPVGNGELKP